MSQNLGEKTSGAAGQGVGRRIFLALALAAVAVLVGLLSLGLAEEPAAPLPAEPEVPAVEEAPPEPVALSFVCVGDIMVHRSQIASQYDTATGLYDYTDNFRFVRERIRSADLALANVETTFAGGTPTGYPSFNAPDALADALADTGFDVAITANNHLYDKGLAGLERTLGILRIAGMETAGTQLADEPAYALVEVKGVRVAVVAYTYETPSTDGRTYINGVLLPTEHAERVNSFSHERLDADLAEVGAVIADARVAGADVVVLYYHWGEEYQRSPNLWQRQIAERTADLGADIIFASHPHVLQAAEMVRGPETGRDVPVFFSMGNFLSNQRAETLDNRFTEQGMLAWVDLVFDPETRTVQSAAMRVTGTWLDKYKEGGRDRYAIVPLDQELEHNEALAASGHRGRALQARDDLRSLFGELLEE